MSHFPLEFQFEIWYHYHEFLESVFPELEVVTFIVNKTTN